CRSPRIVLVEDPRPPRSRIRERGSLTLANHRPRLRLTSAFAGTSRPEGSGCASPRALDLGCRSRERQQSRSATGGLARSVRKGQNHADLSGRLQIDHWRGETHVWAVKNLAPVRPE